MDDVILIDLNTPSIVQVDPDPQTRRRKIHCKQELIVNSLQRFYAAHPEREELVKLLEGTSNMSLRLIDWFVTNYAKQHNISYIINGQEFLVYTNYKSQLKAYSKKLFDPFCRRERIMFQLPETPAFMTTVGKLNIFRWAVEKGVLNYIQLNLATIEKAMNASARELQKKRTGTPATEASVQGARGVTRKRVTSSSAAASNIQKHALEVEVRLD